MILNIISIVVWMYNESNKFNSVYIVLNKLKIKYYLSKINIFYFAISINARTLIVAIF